ncbi:MAG: MFS transporter, partial [Pseudomonadota bacterium]
VATAQQAANFPGGTTEAGVYVVGTGDTGAGMTFLTLGIVYFFVMMIAAFQYRVPAKDWKPEGFTPAPDKGNMVTTNHVHIDEALRTPQFWLLWIVLCFNVTAGIGVIGVAKTMINEIFGQLAIVTIAFAGTYVLMISVFNMVGRFFWASTSDFIGRKNTYHCFFVLGTALYLSVPYFAASGGETALIGFYIATMIIFTMYGGGFATIPAYLADMFGTMHVGGIHGRLLTAWSTAGVLGPFAITYLRDMSRNSAIQDLAAKVDPTAFADKFGAPIGQLPSLVDAKTVTIAKLMEIAPSGTIDPTPTLYNTTMYAMAALLIIAFFANLMV